MFLITNNSRKEGMENFSKTYDWFMKSKMFNQMMNEYFSAPLNQEIVGLSQEELKKYLLFNEQAPRICFLHIESEYFLKMKTLRNELDEVIKNHKELTSRFDALEIKFGVLDTKFGALDTKICALDTKFDTNFNLLMEEIRK